jgi:hypothetical protein
VALQASVDAATGDTTLTVPNAQDTNWTFQWFIDGTPLTATPLAHADQLILLSSFPQPGKLCEVVVYEGQATLTSQAINLQDPSAVTTVSGSTTPPILPGSPASPGTTSSQTGDPSTITTPVAVSPLAVPAGNSSLINLSTMGTVKPGVPLIAGFVITGTSSKALLIRGIGPTLATFGVTGALDNPSLALFQGSAQIESNDDWGSSAGSLITQANEAVGAFPLPSGSLDSALLVTLQPGAYTAQVTSVDGGTGTAMVELYDASTDTVAQSHLVNISSRSYVGSPGGSMTVGFIIGGDLPKTVLIRGVGPGLSQFGVTDFMPDPKLTLYSGSAKVAVNDDWGASPNPAAIVAAAQLAGAPSLSSQSLDAAILVTLQPGAYTAVVTTGSTSSTPGEALVEVYEVSATQ